VTGTSAALRSPDRRHGCGSRTHVSAVAKLAWPWGGVFTSRHRPARESGHRVSGHVRLQLVGIAEALGGGSQSVKHRSGSAR
jgi:hypothetical protein